MALAKKTSEKRRGGESAWAETAERSGEVRHVPQLYVCVCLCVGGVEGRRGFEIHAPIHTHFLKPRQL